MKKIIFLSVLCLISSAILFAQSKTIISDTAHHTLYTCTMHPEVLMDKPGKCPKCGMTLVAFRKTNSKMYTCTMHPEVVMDKPGKCPKCGMDLVKKKSHSKMDSTMHKMPM